MDKKIVWEFMHNEEAEKTEEELEEDEELENSYEDEEYEDENATQLIATPFGTYRVNDKYNPLRLFVWWVGHANFNLSQSVILKLRKIPGIELLKVNTRYRFMIAVGKAFHFSDVRKDIERALDIIKDGNIDENKIIESLASKHDKWAILFSDGSHMTATDADYEEGVKEFNEYLKDNKGKMITHNDIRRSTPR